MEDFNPGMQVTVKLDTLRPGIAEMLSGRVGVVLDEGDYYGRVVVTFTGTRRAGGIFAFNENQLTLVH